MDTAGNAALGVERNVVLNPREIGGSEGAHFHPLPVLLEPAARITVDGKLGDEQALYRRFVDREALLKLNFGHVALPYWPWAL